MKSNWRNSPFNFLALELPYSYLPVGKSGHGASMVAQQYRIHLPMQETQVWYLGWEDALEKEMATYSRILAWEISWTEECNGL